MSGRGRARALVSSSGGITAGRGRGLFGQGGAQPGGLTNGRLGNPLPVTMDTNPSLGNPLPITMDTNPSVSKSRQPPTAEEMVSSLIELPTVESNALLNTGH